MKAERISLVKTWFLINRDRSNMKITSVDEFTALVIQYENSWFRGVSSSKFELKPRIHWANIDRYSEDDFIYGFLREQFKYHSSGNNNPWYIYALMQHHGLPTRLLDWSKSPLIALYFALTQKSVDQDDPRIWIMNPYKLNGFFTGVERVFCPSQTNDQMRYIETNTFFNSKERYLEAYPHGLKVKMLFDSYLPDNLAVSEKTQLLDFPMAIETIPLDSRMAAQQSAFTVHGRNTKPLDEQVPSGIVTFIDIDYQSRHKLLQQLYRLGIVEDTVHCDLDSLAKRLRREKGIS